jgi:inorganic pyrophosphatase
MVDKRITGVAVTVDHLKRDSEVKILLGCTPEEKQIVHHQHNNEHMNVLLINRDD